MPGPRWRAADARGSGLSRRSLLGAAALAGTAAFGLTGCSGPTGSGTRLDYWHLMSGGDGILMGDMVEAINTEQPDFTTEQTVLAWGAPYYTKLAMTSVAGRAPQLAVMHHTRVPGYAPGGLLDPWDLDRLAALGVQAENFPERIWEKGKFEGQTYAIALDSHPFVMMVNNEIAAKAGVAASDGSLEMSSPEQLVEVGTKLAEASGRTGMSFGFLGDGAQMWRFFYTLYRQQGAEMTLTPGRPAEYDMDAAVTALTTIRSLLDGKIATQSADGGGAIAEFAGGTSGALFTGVWETPTMLDAGIDFTATTIPQLFAEPAAYADSHSFVLPHQENPDPAAVEAAYAFVARMLKESGTWAQAGHIPAFLPVVDSAEYRALPQSSYADATEIINYDPEAYFTGSGSDFQTYFAENVQTVLLGRTEPAAGMAGFMDRVDSLLSKPNPVRR